MNENKGVKVFMILKFVKKHIASVQPFHSKKNLVNKGKLKDLINLVENSCLLRSF